MTRAYFVEPMEENIKVEIEKPKQEIEDSMTTSDKVACTTPEGHILEE